MKDTLFFIALFIIYFFAPAGYDTKVLILGSLFWGYVIYKIFKIYVLPKIKK